MTDHFLEPGDTERFLAASGAVDWRALDQSAFEGYPEAQSAIAASLDEASESRSAGGCLTPPLSTLAEFGPVLAFLPLYLTSVFSPGGWVPVLISAWRPRRMRSHSVHWTGGLHGVRPS